MTIQIIDQRPPASRGLAGANADPADERLPRVMHGRRPDPIDAKIAEAVVGTLTPGVSGQVRVRLPRTARVPVELIVGKSDARWKAKLSSPSYADRADPGSVELWYWASSLAPAEAPPF